MSRIIELSKKCRISMLDSATHCVLGQEKRGGKIKIKTAGSQKYTLELLIDTIFIIMSYASLRQKTFIQCESLKRWGAQLSHANFALHKIWQSKQTYMSKHQHVPKERNWFGVSDATSLQDRIRRDGIPVRDGKILSEMCSMLNK